MMSDWQKDQLEQYKNHKEFREMYRSPVGFLMHMLGNSGMSLQIQILNLAIKEGDMEKIKNYGQTLKETYDNFSSVQHKVYEIEKELKNKQNQ